jgi:hypothetical protein
MKKIVAIIGIIGIISLTSCGTYEDCRSAGIQKVEKLQTEQSVPA